MQRNSLGQAIRMLLLSIAFFATALIYATVGFAGGSTYGALMIIAEVDYRVLPSIVLCCNLIVVIGGSLRATRRGLVDPRLVIPFTLLSAPMAWAGGRLPIDRGVFMLVLGIVLLASGLVMMARIPDQPPADEMSRRRAWAIGLPTGALLGLVAGTVGIGGGVFLAPILHLTRLAGPRRIAATASIFILVNSAAGLLGQTMKQGAFLQSEVLADFLPLFAAVFIGGQIGSHIGFAVLPARALRVITAMLVIYGALRLLRSWLGMIGV
jgi:uncharacterized membrane protein YfcA